MGGETEESRDMSGSFLPKYETVETRGTAWNAVTND
jgi:hypothetical protein